MAEADGAPSDDAGPGDGSRPPPDTGFLLGVHVAETSALETYVDRLDLARRVRAQVVRVPVDWARLEGNGPGEFDPAYLAELRGRMAALSERGMEAVVLLAQSPGWASGHPEDPAFPPTPEHAADYGSALSRLADELEGPVLAWEVWNEPNSVEFWPAYRDRQREGTFVLVPLEAASEYALLLEAAYEAVKAAHPEAVVLGGSLASADTEYLAALLDVFQGQVPMDALSLHPYARVDERQGPHYGYAQYPDQCNEDIDPLSPPWCFERGLELVRAVLRDRGFDRPVWLTEFGVSSGDAWGDAGSEQEQARHLEIALDILGRRWGREDLNVAAALWYRLVDEGDDLFGLFHETGQPKLAASVFASKAP